MKKIISFLLEKQTKIVPKLIQFRVVGLGRRKMLGSWRERRAGGTKNFKAHLLSAVVHCARTRTRM